MESSPAQRRHLRSVVVDGRRGNSPQGPVILMVGFKAAMDSAEIARVTYLANHLQRVVVAVENPGYGFSHARLTREQGSHLRAGDFGPMAAEILTEAAHNIPVPLAEAVLIGYSMGASVAAAAARLMATEPNLGPAAAVLLVEPVATKPWTFPALAVANWQEEHRADPDGRRPAPPPTPAPEPGQFGPRGTRWDLLSQLTGIRRGRIADDLAQAAALGKLTVHLAHGGRSFLSPTLAVATLRSRLDISGCPGELVTIPGGWHDLWAATGGMHAALRPLL